MGLSHRFSGKAGFRGLVSRRNLREHFELEVGPGAVPVFAPVAQAVELEVGPGAVPVFAPVAQAVELEAPIQGETFLYE